MKVLKFGGTSVANSKSIDSVLEIIKKNDCSLTVTVSALGGITNMLSNMIKKAAEGERNYKSEIILIKKRHIEVIEAKIPVKKQDKIVSFLKIQLHELENFLDSVFSLKEATQRSSAKIISFGEVLSSQIIFEIIKNKNKNI